MNTKKLTDIEVLAMFYYHHRELQTILVKCDEMFFASKYRPFYKFMKKYIEGYKSVPSKQTIVSEFPEEQQPEIIDIFDHVEETHNIQKEMDYCFLKDKVIEFVKVNLIREVMVNAYDVFELGDYDKTVSVLSKAQRMVMMDLDLGLDHMAPQSIYDRYQNKETDKIIPTGSLQLDEKIMGWHRGGLHVLAAKSNLGKTMFSCSFTSSLLLNEKLSNLNILYITLEIDADEISKRIDASTLNIPMRDFYKTKDNNAQEVLNELLVALNETYKKNLTVKEMLAYRTTPNDIDALIRNLEIVTGKKPDILFLDYMGLMRPNDYSPSMNSYERGMNLAVELRSLAKEHNLALITGAQMNRGGYGKVADLDNIADSLGIVMTADLVLSLTKQTDEFETEAIIEAYLAKSRYSRNGYKFLYSVNYDCQRVDDILGSAKFEGAMEVSAEEVNTENEEL